MKEPQEEFDLEKRARELRYRGFQAPEGMMFSPSLEDLKSLLRDFSKYITPERMGEGLQPQYSKGKNQAITEIEANTRKVLGDEH